MCCIVFAQTCLNRRLIASLPFQYQWDRRVTRLAFVVISMFCWTRGRWPRRPRWTFPISVSPASVLVVCRHPKCFDVQQKRVSSVVRWNYKKKLRQEGYRWDGWIIKQRGERRFERRTRLKRKSEETLRCVSWWSRDAHCCCLGWSTRMMRRNLLMWGTPLIVQL